MISSAASSPSSVLPPPTASSNNAPAKGPSEGDSTGSFSDVMQQHEGSSNPKQSDQAPATPTNPASAKTTVPTTPATTAPTKTPVTSLAPASNLSALMVQASVQASKAPTTALATTAGNPAPIVTPKANAPAEPVDLSTLIAQATALLSGGKTIVTAKTSSSPAPTTGDKTAKDSVSGKTSAQAPTTAASTSIDLSTLIAQSTLVAQFTTTRTGNELPSSGVIASGVGSVTKEKKSATTSAGGSFLQSGTSLAASAETAFGMLTGLQAVASGAAVSQQLTTGAGTKNNSAESVAAAAISAAGTANVEKKPAMNALSNIPELTLLSGNGGNAVPSQSSADLHIQLASNSDFTDALKQVMHVAQLTQTSESRTPMRVEMEIQTPPGAVVNVYVSKQADGWRAQLSTNDPAALSWVQDQITSLRQSSDVGVEVKWLPPQLEGSASITTSGSQDSNLSWNQGGQDQSNYQQPDERQQSSRQQNADDISELTASSSNPFMETLAALGRAA